MAALLGASCVFAQREKADAHKADALVYAELAKAPDKARAKRNPLENDRDAVAAGHRTYSSNIVPNATAMLATALRRPLVSAPTKSRTPHREPFFGF